MLRLNSQDAFFFQDIFASVVVVVVVVFTLKAVPISAQYLVTSVLVQLTRTPSVVTGYLPKKGCIRKVKENKRAQKSQHKRDN